jgi:NADPH-dependent 2,4-dienoyl-CoA reductase/sulfur reductase-like enzyme
MNPPATVVVVGAGPAGMRAACEIADAGQPVLLIDDNPQVGGQIWRTLPTSPAQHAAQRVHTHPNITLWTQSSIIAPLPQQRLLVERPTSAAIVSYTHLIIATGARERLLPLPGWTLPGVMGIGGLQALVKTGMPIAGKRVLIAGSGPLIWPVAQTLRAHGAHIVAIAERQPLHRLARFAVSLIGHPSKLVQALTTVPGLVTAPIHVGTRITAITAGTHGLTATLQQSQRELHYDADIVAIGDHLVPNYELAVAMGCVTTPAGIVTDPDTLATSCPHVYAIGEARGVGGIDCALAEGTLVALQITQHHQRLPAARRSVHRERAFATHLARIFGDAPAQIPLPADTIVCRCEDVTHAQLHTHTSWRAAKLHTRCGMGPCQGRICGVACEHLYGWGQDAVRPPLRPARVSTLALLATTEHTD